MSAIAGVRSSLAEKITTLSAVSERLPNNEEELKMQKETIPEMTIDYLELIEKLMNIGYKHAEDDSAFNADLKKLLNEKAKSVQEKKERIGIF
jgi:hypothetical protein